MDEEPVVGEPEVAPSIRALLALRMCALLTGMPT
jgi:hypothetical protein